MSTTANIEEHARPSEEAAKVLLVDDEQNVLRALRRAFRRTGWEISTAGSGEEALELLAAQAADVVISDFRMPGMSGVELLRQVKERWPQTQRVMLTGQADQSAIQEAVNRSEIYRFLGKPWDDTELIAVVHSAVEAAQLARENRRLLQLTLEKNDELARLNASLEEKVQERTARLAQSQREWEAAFDALDVPLAIIDRDHRVRRANRAWAEHARIGGKDVLGENCHAGAFGSREPCVGCALPEVLAHRTKIERELTLGGRQLVVSIHPWPDAEALVVVSYRDVTEERRRDDWKRRTERLAAVGRLAGGVAHEINNPLSGVLAFSQILRKEPGRSAEDIEALQLIEESAVRCKKIVESLQRFSGGGGEAQRQPVDLHRVTADTVLLFRPQMKHRVGAKLELLDDPAELPTLLADPAALGQALMDLLHHRLRALPESGGTLELALVAEPEGACWKLRDSAHPLSRAEVEQLADPAADGSGLTLVYRVVGEHGGRVDVTPEPHGNLFTLHIRKMEAP